MRGSVLTMFQEYGSWMKSPISPSVIPANGKEDLPFVFADRQYRGHFCVRQLGVTRVALVLVLDDRHVHDPAIDHQGGAPPCLQPKLEELSDARGGPPVTLHRGGLAQDGLEAATELR